MKLILATHNRHKIEELSAVLRHKDIRIESLFDYPEIVLPPETGETFVENAMGKARAVFESVKDGGAWILADDSGLVVDALDGRPGVYSSRYSGEPTDYARNNRKLLDELKGVPREKRTAHFVCSIVLMAPDGKVFELEGRVDGLIMDAPAGGGGFGYDPVFFVPEFGRTVAEIPLERKNKISHRGLATQKALAILVEFLKNRG
jgi:XTP/dITP diphosphohydrolase